MGGPSKCISKFFPGLHRQGSYFARLGQSRRSRAIRGRDNPPGALVRQSNGAELEPITLLAALAPMTRHIGLVSTGSTTYSEPLQPRAPVSLPRSSQRRPCGVECGHLVGRRGCAQLRAFVASGLRLALRARGRICRRGARALAQLGRRRLPARQEVGVLLRPGQTPCAQSQGQILFRARRPRPVPVVARAGPVRARSNGRNTRPRSSG